MLAIVLQLFSSSFLLSRCNQFHPSICFLCSPSKFESLSHFLSSQSHPKTFRKILSMSDTSESAPSSPKVQPKNDKPDIVRELVLWRRKQLNVFILLAATATWILMEVYQYNFATLLSWLAMAVLSCFFVWGNIHRLLKKEAPDLSELEISEGAAMETANLLRKRIEEGIQLMFYVSAEREWFVFAGVVVCFYFISVAAAHLDFLTVSYIGLVGGLTIPVTYVKYENKIREYGEKLRIKSERFYGIIEEKLRKMKNKIAGHRKEVKEKKME